MAENNDGNDAAALLKDKGNTLFGEGKFAEADVVYTEAIALDGNMEVLYSNRYNISNISYFLVEIWKPFCIFYNYLFLDLHLTYYSAAVRLKLDRVLDALIDADKCISINPVFIKGV